MDGWHGALCRHTQEEPYGKKSSMGSENRQRSFKGNLKCSVTRSIAPKSSRYAETEAQKGYEYSTSSATYAVKPGGN